jgi:hypothetical protein
MTVKVIGPGGGGCVACAQEKTVHDKGRTFLIGWALGALLVEPELCPEHESFVVQVGQRIEGAIEGGVMVKVDVVDKSKAN